MKLLLVTMLFTSICVAAQDDSTADRKLIYQKVITELSGSGISIINETIAPIYKYDIDGDYQQWFYQKHKKAVQDSSVITVSVICVVPIEYEMTLLQYAEKRGLSLNSSSLHHQIDNSSADSLNKYVTAQNIISFRKAPLKNFTISNLFKKTRAVGLSSILFNKSNQLAFVKTQIFSKRRERRNNPSKILILQKKENGWDIVDILEEKQQRTEHL